MSGMPRTMDGKKVPIKKGEYFYSIKELGEILNKTPATLYREVQKGTFPVYRLPGDEPYRRAIHVRERDLLEIMEKAAAQPPRSGDFPGRVRGCKTRLQEVKARRRQRAEEQWEAHNPTARKLRESKAG